MNFGDDFIPDMMGMGIDYSCFGMNGTLRCFGRNNQGSLGYGDTVNRGGCGSSFADVNTLSDINFGTDFQIAQMQIHGKHGCVLSTKSELKCWGKTASIAISFSLSVAHTAFDNIEHIGQIFNDFNVTWCLDQEWVSMAGSV